MKSKKLLNFSARFSSECLSFGVETIWSWCSPLIDSIHWFVTLIAWYLHLIILNNVLFDDGLSCAECACLCYSLWVEVCLGDEAVISWNVRGSLGGSCCQLMILIQGLCGIWSKLISWVVPISSQRLLILSVEVASLRWISLSWIRPERSLGFCQRLWELIVIDCLVVWGPMGGGSGKRFFSGNLKCWHLSGLLVVILGASSVLEQLRLMSKLICNYIINSIRLWLDLITYQEC